jgi:hypothetical protein
MLRRLEDRIRELCAKAAATSDGTALHEVVEELQALSTSKRSASGNWLFARPLSPSGELDGDALPVPRHANSKCREFDDADSKETLNKPVIWAVTV